MWVTVAHRAIVSVLTQRPEADHTTFDSSFLVSCTAIDDISSPRDFIARATLVEGRLYHRTVPSSADNLALLRFMTRICVHPPEPTYKTPSCPKAKAETGAGMANVATVADVMVGNKRDRFWIGAGWRGQAS